MNQKGSLLIILLISSALVLLIGGGGVFYYISNSATSPTDENPQEEQSVVQEKVTTTSLPQDNRPLPAPSQKTASASGMVSGVEGWKTYSLANPKFSIKYPGTWYTKTADQKITSIQTTSQLFNNKPMIDDNENLIAEVATMNIAFEEMTKVFNYDDGTNKIVSLVEPITVQGKQAYKVTLQSSKIQEATMEAELKKLEKLYAYFVPQDGFLIEVDILKQHDDIARKMLETIKVN